MSDECVCDDPLGLMVCPIHHLCGHCYGDSTGPLCDRHALTAARADNARLAGELEEAGAAKNSWYMRCRELERAAEDTSAVLGQVVVAGTLRPGESISNAIDHAAVTATLHLLAERDRLAGEYQAADDRAETLAQQLEDTENARLSWVAAAEKARAQAARLEAVVEVTEALADVALEILETSPERRSSPTLSLHASQALKALEVARGGNPPVASGANRGDDEPLPEDAAIKAAHPIKTGRHALYAEAMWLVGAKSSKGALVELVNWLLLRAEGPQPRDPLKSLSQVEFDELVPISEEEIRAAIARGVREVAIAEGRRTFGAPPDPSIDQLLEVLNQARAAGRLPNGPTREERISWVDGNCKLSNPDVTREMVEHAVDEVASWGEEGTGYG